MHPIIHSIYNYIGKSSVGFHENQRFSDIFFDKFKNLLDDYIVNYQIKYFFYILFISFFYLELSEGMFQLMHNYSSYHLSIFGSFLIDFCYSLFNVELIDFLYSYFAFNLNFIGYFMSLLSNHDIYFSIGVMGMVACIIAEKYEHYKSTLNIRLLSFSYLIYSFFFFIPFFMNYISLGFYIFITLILAVLYVIVRVCNVQNIKLDESDFILAFIIFSFAFFPYYLIFICFVFSVYFLLNQYVPLLDGRPFSIRNFNSAYFGDLLMLGVLAFFIIPINYAYYSAALFILNSFPFVLYIIYIYRDEPYDSRSEKTNE
jgi:hypothetical protein